MQHGDTKVSHSPDQDDLDDVTFTTAQIPAIVAGIKRLLKKPRRKPQVGLVERMNGAPDNGRSKGVEIPDGIDLERFDETLINTLR